MADIRSGVQNYLAVEEPASLDRYYAITTIMCHCRSGMCAQLVPCPYTIICCIVILFWPLAI